MLGPPPKLAPFILTKSHEQALIRRTSRLELFRSSSLVARFRGLAKRAYAGFKLIKFPWGKVTLARQSNIPFKKI